MSMTIDWDLVDQTIAIILEEMEEGHDCCLYKEENVKNICVIPLLEAMGYSAKNPKHIKSEVSSDYEIKKKPDCADYVIRSNKGIPLFLVEAKNIKVKQFHESVGQLQKYYSVKKSKHPDEPLFCLLTNGLKYQFFRDSVSQNILDDKPFFEFNILHMTEKEKNTLELLSREIMWTEPNRILEHQKDLTITTFIKSLMNDSEPLHKFVSFISENTKVDKELIDLGMVVKVMNEQSTEYLERMEAGDFIEEQESMKGISQEEKELYQLKLHGTMDSVQTAERQRIANPKPSLIKLLDSKIPVQKLKDVIIETCEELIRRFPNRANDLEEQFPNNDRSVKFSRNISRFTPSSIQNNQIKELSNGLFVTTHLSKEAVLELCYGLMKFFEVKSSSFTVYSEKGEVLS